MKTSLKRINNSQLVFDQAQPLNFQPNNVVELNRSSSTQSPKSDLEMLLVCHVAEHFFKTDEQMTYASYLKLVDELKTLKNSLSEDIV